MIDRKADWRPALYEYFDDVRRKSFDKDTNNCAHFVANGWLVMRNDDPFAAYRECSTFAALVKALTRDGYMNHSDFFKTFMDEYEHPSQAQVGDIAVFKTDDEIGYASGWVIGDLVFVMRENGLGSLPLAAAEKAFKV